MTMRSSIVATCASCARQVQRAHTPAVAWRRAAPLLSAQQGRPVRARTPTTAALATGMPGACVVSLARPFSQSAPNAGKRKKNLKKKRLEAEAAKEALKPLPYYELFAGALPDGPPPTGRFMIDTQALRKEYLRLQAEAHPDFFHDGGGEAGTGTDTATSGNGGGGSGGSGGDDSNTRGHSALRARAEAQSAHINEAYRTLLSPLLRVQYILRERYGVDLASDETTMFTGDPEEEDEATLRKKKARADKYAGIDKQYRRLFELFDNDDEETATLATYSPSGPTTKAESNTRLLMAVLETHEEIEQARTESDLEPIQDLNHLRRNHSEDIIDAAFAQEDIPAVQDEAVRLRYWVSIDEALRNWQPGKAVVLPH